jgi:NitT/TauT family transport system substrate-binding protein
MRERFFKAAFGGRLMMIGLVLVSSSGGAARGAEPAWIQATAVYGVISTDAIYLWMAQEKGIFKKNGLDLSLTHIPTNQAVQALVGGKINFTTTGPQALEAALAGSDTVYILGPINSFVLSIYARPEISGIRGLTGKTLAATNKGTPTDVAGRLVLKQNGLTPDLDVKFVYLKEIPALVAALKEGVIDAAVIPPPSTSQARSLGLKELLNVTELKIPFVQHAVATTRSYINANPDAAKRFVRSAAEALQFTLANRTDALSVLSKYTKITDPVLLNEALDAYEKAWEKIPLPSQAAVEAVLAASPNPKAKEVRWDRFVEDSFVREIAASGFFK